MKNQNSSEWLHEFNEFMSFESAKVPDSLSDKVLTKIDRLLNPKAHNVFLKILGIQTVVGFLSLSVCHQFGMNPFRTATSLADVFMRWGGHGLCMVFCGLLFTALGLSAAGLFLSIEEIRALRRTEFSQAIGISTISLGLFFIAGAEFVFSLAGLWMLGALLGGFFSIEANFWLRQKFNFVS